jgi:hypothetical protein
MFRIARSTLRKEGTIMDFWDTLILVLIAIGVLGSLWELDQIRQGLGKRP